MGRNDRCCGRWIVCRPFSRGDLPCRPVVPEHTFFALRGQELAGPNGLEASRMGSANGRRKGLDPARLNPDTRITPLLNTHTHHMDARDGRKVLLWYGQCCTAHRKTALVEAFLEVPRVCTTSAQTICLCQGRETRVLAPAGAFLQQTRCAASIILNSACVQTIPATGEVSESLVNHPPYKTRKRVLLAARNVTENLLQVRRERVALLAHSSGRRALD